MPGDDRRKIEKANTLLIVILKRTSRFFFLSCAIWFSACNTQKPTALPRAESTQITPPTATLIIRPTETFTQTLSPDQNLTATIQAPSDSCYSDPEFSPNHQWSVITCADVKNKERDEASAALKIINLQSGQKWVVTYYQIYGVREIEATGHMSNGIVFTEQWSASGDYLYIGVMPNVFSEFVFNRTAALFRLTLQTGEITEVLPVGNVQKTFYDYSISSDDTKIAFIKLLQGPLQIETKVISTGALKSMQLDAQFSVAGSLVWSQDNQKLIFVAANFEGAVPTTIFQWDGQAKTPRAIGQLNNQLAFIVQWDEAKNLIKLRDYFFEKYLELDPSNGQLQAITP